MNKEQCNDILCTLTYIEYAIDVINGEVNHNISAPKESFENLDIQTSFIRSCLNDINDIVKEELES